MKLTPWQYLNQWSMSDRLADQNEEWIYIRMQELYPGPYKIGYGYHPNGWKEFHIIFEDQTEETFFRLKYS